MSQLSKHIACTQTAHTGVMLETNMLCIIETCRSLLKEASTKTSTPLSNDISKRKRASSNGLLLKWMSVGGRSRNHLEHRLHACQLCLLRLQLLLLSSQQLCDLRQLSLCLHHPAPVIF